MEKIFNQKSFPYFFGTVELAYRYIFSFKFTLPPVSLAPVANFPPVSRTPAELVAKFATGVVDIGGAL
jgi:hypothetical protein